MNAQPNFPFGPDIAPVFLGLVCALLIGLLIAVIMYLVTLQTALGRVAPHNRRMEPGMVWLALVPCVNIIWKFMIAVHVPESLKNEFRERGRDDGSDYGKSIALTGAIVDVAGGFLGNLTSRFPGQGGTGNIIAVAALVLGLILFVVFWAKVANYSRMLLEDDGELARRLERFGDDDDRYGGPRPTTDPPPPPSDGFKAGDPGEDKYTPRGLE